MHVAGLGAAWEPVALSASPGFDPCVCVACGVHEVVLACGAEETSIRDEAGVERADADTAWLGVGVGLSLGLGLGLGLGLRLLLGLGLGLGLGLV